jgi:hypothetical protein
VFPLASFVAVIFIYIHSKFLIWRLLNHKRQPLSASNDMGTGTTMNMYVSMSFMIAFIFNSIILFVKTPRFNFW